MTKTIITSICFIISICISAHAKQVPSKAHMQNPEGYWVLESNIRKPDQSIIYFYSADHQLMYKETLTGIVVNPQKQRTQKKLNKLLTEIYYGWEWASKSEKQLVYKSFKP